MSFFIDDLEITRRSGNKVNKASKFYKSDNFGELIKDITIERTIEGASTITVECFDPTNSIVNMEEFTTKQVLYPTELEIKGYRFALAGISKGAQGDVTLTFEDLQVNAMRRYKKPRRAKRAKQTRAQFCRSLVEETYVIPSTKNTKTKLTLVAPEEKEVQLIGEGGQTQEEAIKNDTGFPAGTKLKYLKKVKQGKKTVNKIKTCSTTQLGYYRDIFKECKKQKAPTVVYKAIALIAASGSDLANTGDRNLFGASKSDIKKAGAAGTNPKRTKERLTVYIVKQLKKKHKANTKLSEIQLAAKTIGRKEDVMQPYLKYSNNAYRLWSKGLNGGTDVYEFSRGEPNGEVGEDTWSAITRMASEVGWRCYCDKGVVFFVSEDYIMQKPTSLSLSMGDDGVNSIDWSEEGGSIPAEANVSVIAESYSINPADIVEVKDEGLGSGKWIVSSVSQSFFSPECSVTLKRRQPKLVEPVGNMGDLAEKSTIPPQIQNMIKKAQALTGGKYVYGASDCSSTVSQVLRAGGFSPTGATPVLNNFGQSGKGKFFTLYSYGAGKTGHCWINWEKASGLGGKRFEYRSSGSNGIINGHQFSASTLKGQKLNVRHAKGF